MAVEPLQRHRAGVGRHVPTGASRRACGRTASPRRTRRRASRSGWSTATAPAGLPCPRCCDGGCPGRRRRRSALRRTTPTRTQFTFPVTLGRRSAPAGAVGRGRPGHLPDHAGRGDQRLLRAGHGRPGHPGPPDVLPQCVSFFAYDPESNRFSAPVAGDLHPVETSVPDAPVIEEATWDPARPAFLAPATYAEGTHLVYAMERRPGDLPARTTSTGAAGDRGRRDHRRRHRRVHDRSHRTSACPSTPSTTSPGVASEPTQVVVHAPLPDRDPRRGGAPGAPGLPVVVRAGDRRSRPATTSATTSSTAPARRRLPRSPVADAAARGRRSVVARGRAVTPSSRARAPGTNCVMFTSLDWWGWQGSKVAPGRMTDRHGPGRDARVRRRGASSPRRWAHPCGTSSLGKFEVPVSYTGGLHAIYDPATRPRVRSRVRPGRSRSPSPVADRHQCRADAAGHAVLLRDLLHRRERRSGAAEPGVPGRPRRAPGLTCPDPGTAYRRAGLLWQTRGRAAPQHHYRLARRDPSPR